MIVIQSGEPLIKSQRPEPPGYVVNPITETTSQGSTVATTLEDANVLRSETSTVRTEACLCHDLESNPTYESLDESVATVDSEGRVSHVADGTVGVIASFGYDRQRVDITVSEEGGVTTDEFVSWVTGSAAKHSTDNVENAISGLTPSDNTLQIFSDFDHSAGTYTRNASLWAAVYASALTGCNAWQSNYGSGQSRAQTAITKRHIVGAAHYSNPITIGGTQRFVAADGTVVNRTVTHTRRIAGTDIQLSLLNEDLPETIVPVSVLPATFGNQFRRITEENTTYGIPCLLRNQFGEARIYDVRFIITGKSSFSTFVMPASRLPWQRDLVGGDSGGPAMMMIGGKLVLITTWTGSSSGPSYHAVDWSTEITALDALASINTGYTPDVVDLTSFTDFS